MLNSTFYLSCNEPSSTKHLLADSKLNLFSKISNSQGEGYFGFLLSQYLFPIVV